MSIWPCMRGESGSSSLDRAVPAFRPGPGTGALREIRYQLCIGLISFPLQFLRRGRNPAVAPRRCAMLESGCPRIAGPLSGR